MRLCGYLRLSAELAAGLCLHSDRIDRRRAFWILEAIQSSLGQRSVEWYKCRCDSDEEAIARYNLDRVKSASEPVTNPLQGAFPFMPSFTGEP